MKRYATMLLPLLTAGLLAACGTADIARMQVKGGAFEQGLHDGYVTLANEEFDQLDLTSGNAFGDRAKLAAMGDPPKPEPIAARKLVAPHTEELTNARDRLMTAFGKGAASKDGTDAATAQVMFDCWMEQAEENIQPDDIAHCKNGFLAAMNRVDAALVPAVASAPAPSGRDTYVIYFKTNSTTLDQPAWAILRAAAAKAGTMTAAKVMVTGYTDRRGTRDYNTKLSARRADVVTDALAKDGVAKARIETMSEGETHPAVATADGQGEHRNRRVEVVVAY